ncbi:CAAD domain-containing protein [Fischerella sp. JS2]|uniref:CAAD domain-containing protein n=1 Tax=Fischerella sp. JS2 TaxID=2597771 RepID=UPI0028EF6F00|nr:CAAD domain-containing protein [Fischerella sp. JS2]
METEVQQKQYNDVPSTEAVAAIEGSDSQNLAKLPPAQESESQWQLITRELTSFWQEISQNFNKFFQAYKPLLINLAWLLAAVVSVKVILAVLDAINDIPLAQPVLELVGISYTIWFVFRYLLKDSTRQELVTEIDSVKKQFLG